MKLTQVHFLPEICAPHSKSFAIRAIIASALSDKPTRLIFKGLCDDTKTALNCCQVLGASYELIEEGALIYPSDNIAPQCNFGDCASALRMIYPAALYLNPGFSFSASERLKERIHGSLPCREELLSENFICDVSETSQLFSGILLQKALCGGKAILRENAVSMPYIVMTLSVLESFGVNYSIEHSGGNIVYTFSGTQRFTSPGCYTVEGDYSGASNLLVAGCIGKSAVRVSGLNPSSLQGDRRILDILAEAGAKIERDENGVTVFPSSIHCLTVDASDIPDLVPCLAILFCSCTETSVIKNVKRLKYKESDRISEICNVISSSGGTVSFDGNNLYVRGPAEGGRLPVTGDHRIAIAEVLMTLLAPCEIDSESFLSLNKSYPDFINTFRS